MSIIEEGDDVAGKVGDRQQPWWFIPGLVAVGIGALIGSLLDGTVPPPSPGPSHAAASPRGVNAPTTYSYPCQGVGCPPTSTQGTSACPSCRVVTQPPATARPSGTFAPVLRPARVFVFDEAKSLPATYPELSLVRLSRYVLYDDGSFVLQCACLPAIEEQRGTYTEADGVIKFEWSEMWSRDGPMEATGHLKGNFLSVRYGFAMLEGWDDAVFVQR